MDRREFLKSSVLVGGAGTFSTRARAAAAPVASSFDPWVEIHLENLRHNVAQVSERVGGRPVLAVIKNNGYGTGVAHVARLLEPMSAIHGFATVKLQEAVAVREAGVEKPVLLMGPFDEADLKETVHRGITPMVYTPMGGALDRLAEERQSAVGIHVCVDTGIGRVGVPHRDAAELIRDLALRPSVRIEGTMMTFAEDAELDGEQKERFDVLCSGLTTAGVRLGRRHAASSFALFQHPDYFLDMVRPGMAIYGVYPEQEFRSSKTLELRPALALRARVAYVKKLDKGDSAGYGRAYVAKAPVWVATLPVGHADGLPRAAANKAKVRIGERLYPIVASISASHTIVEIGPEKSVEIGEEVTLFDWRDGSRPEDVSADSGASVYDLTMHLSPLLPRKIV